jgi:hypothetical protein
VALRALRGCGRGAAGLALQGVLRAACCAAVRVALQRALRGRVLWGARHGLDLVRLVLTAVSSGVKQQ